MKTLILTLALVGSALASQAAWVLACFRGTLYIGHHSSSGVITGVQSMGISCGGTNYANPISITRGPGLPGLVYDGNMENTLNQNIHDKSLTTELNSDINAEFAAMLENGSHATTFVREENLTPVVQQLFRENP